MRRALGLFLVVMLLGGGAVASVLGGLITIPNLDLAGLLSSDGHPAAPVEAPATALPARGAQPMAKATATETPDRTAAVAPQTMQTQRAPEATPVRAGSQRAAPPAVKIEVARIDPDGASVLAGCAPADSKVTLFANGKAVATATASADGQWSAVVTQRFPAGPLNLSVAADVPDKGKSEGPMLAVVVPKGSGVAELVAAPAKPRPILQPKAAPAPSQAINELATLVEQARASAAAEKAEGAPRKAVATAEPVAVPVPITFVTGEATMTPEGVHAADLLVEYIRIKAPKAMTLSGHADVRGTDAYNLDLSRQRLEAIEHHLRSHGYAGRLSLLPKGKSEPYAGINRATASYDDILQADRRVELRLVE